MKYKILEINIKQSWIKIEVTFDDNTKYIKRMMADLTSPQTINKDVTQWLADYLDTKVAPNEAIKSLEDKIIEVGVLPKTSRLKAEQERLRLEEEAKQRKLEQEKEEAKRLKEVDVKSPPKG